MSSRGCDAYNQERRPFRFSPRSGAFVLGAAAARASGQVRPTDRSRVSTSPRAPIARAALAQGAAQLRTAAASVPPSGLLVCSIVVVQLGSAIGKQLFATVGSSGAVFLRAVFAAFVLLIIWRPGVRGFSRAQYMAAGLFGLVVAALNFSFYASLARLPLGIAVTVEFLGPLGVAVAGSRRWLDLLWVGLAAGGVALFAPWSGGHLDPVGLALALLAGACWALYILLSARVGRAFSGGAGLALAVGVAALVLAPVGVLSGGAALLRPAALLVGAAAGVLSTVIPFSLEMAALRRLPTHAFGIFMSLEPAMAALIGFLVLRETLGWRSLLAIALVTLASVGSSRARVKRR